MMNEDSKPNLSPDPHEGNVRDVVACVVSDDRGRMLIARRPAHKRHGGLWEFPGGKVLDGESLADAAARELEEELGVRVADAAAEPEFVARDPGSPFRILFLRVAVDGTPDPQEHELLAWFDPATGRAEVAAEAEVAAPRPWAPHLAPADAAYAGHARRLAGGRDASAVCRDTSPGAPPSTP